MAAKLPRRETENKLREPSTSRREAPTQQQQLPQQQQPTNSKVNHQRRRQNHRRNPSESEPPRVSIGRVSVGTVPSVTGQQPSSTAGVAAGAAEQDSAAGGDEILSALQRVTVVVLGARGVGKTSLVRQFVYGDVSCADDLTADVRPSTAIDSSRVVQRIGQCQASPNSAVSAPNFHHVAVVVDRRLYDVRLVDCPPIARFPSSAVQEWTEFRGYGLRHAAAYVIVYDVTDDESFAYVRAMREQIVRCRAAGGATTGSSTGSGSSGIGGSGGSRSNAAGGSSMTQLDVPIIVAANKVDLTVAGSGGTTGGVSGYIGNMANGSGGADKNGLSAAMAGRLQRDAANLVRKQWKCAYVECSARYNWRVVALFRDIMKAVDHATRQHHQTGHHHHHHSSHLQSAAGSFVRVQDALHNNHCNIL